MSGPFLVVDANNLAMRAVHAVRYRRPPESDAEALEHAAGAVDRFLAMLGRHVAAERPQRVVLAWDYPGPSWRVAQRPEYKATRAVNTGPDAAYSAFAQIKEITYHLGIPNAASPGMEADDLIGGFWRGADPARVSCLLIVSSDRDFAQLVGTTARGIPCEQLAPSTDGGDRLTTERVRDRWGCEPHQIPLVKALWGDDGDNIVGIHGVGPKKAVKQLAAAGWVLETALEKYDVTDRERVTMNVSLVDLRNGEFSIPPPVPYSWPDAGYDGLRLAADQLRALGLDKRALQVVTGELFAPRQDAPVGTQLDLEELV